jgi:nucleoside-diphosphate-sugar epimerase
VPTTTSASRTVTSYRDSYTSATRRQFIYSLDLAELTVWVMRDYHSPEPITLSVDGDAEVPIRDVALAVAKAMNRPKSLKAIFSGRNHVSRINRDHGFPDSGHGQTFVPV